MDASLAALLGAGIGVVGTAATAGIAAWATRWQVRVQVQAERDQWRRQARRDAYTNLLRSVTAVRSAVGETADTARAVDPDGDECARLFGAARALGREWDAASAAVLLEGPDPLVRASLPLINSVNQECDVARRWCHAIERNDPQAAKDAEAAYDRIRRETGPLLEAFVQAAHDSLNT
jgi:hypothetical protein